MGGKSYWCDYCECFMKNDINVRKNHNIGTSHNIAKANYLQKFKDPEQIIVEEKIKIPCKKISNNLECSFGFFCRFSHYTPDELNYLQFLIDKNRFKKEKDTRETDPLPWNNSKRRKQIPQPTPTSLLPIDFERIDDSCFNSQWG
ncbi:zinc finger matrin-type protein 5 [Episyrphus balteatus]|uniref:zinc finger matrin-type protein 5 n=1 Tax=Episyrphus balteatus TaxID=286459 RepID=UPI002486C30D|nr:zinc finger matrin-type protein 5 [Episyrphus balteatus]